MKMRKFGIAPLISCLAQQRYGFQTNGKKELLAGNLRKSVSEIFVDEAHRQSKNVMTFQTKLMQMKKERQGYETT